MSPGMPLDGLAQGLPVPTAGLPKDVLTGIVQTTVQMSETINSLAQIVPDLAPDLEAVRQALAVFASKVLMVGGGAATPTATGPGFPGGGLDRGAQPLASGGMA
jgi:hypothetical protein